MDATKQKTRAITVGNLTADARVPCGSREFCSWVMELVKRTEGPVETSLVKEIDEIKQRNKRVDSDIKSLNETADELRLKAESTGKLNLCDPKNNWTTGLDARLNSKLEKLIKEWFDFLSRINASFVSYCMFICRTSHTKSHLNWGAGYSQLSEKMSLKNVLCPCKVITFGR